MLTALLWIVGSVIAADLVLTALGFIVFAVVLNRYNFQDPVAAQDIGLQPLTALPGVAKELPESYWPAVEGAHSQLRKRLGAAGGLLGFLAVATSYFVLTLASTQGWLPFWCLLAFPINGYSKIGSRGLRTDFRLVGPVPPVFMQLFYSSFTSFSLLTVVLILVLRAFAVLP